jgi:alcohol dehydrogenase (NADP+)
MRAGHTLRGCSPSIVVKDKFALKINHSADQLPSPHCCVQILRPIHPFATARRGKKVGIIRIGGVGHMGSSSLRHRGHIVAFTTSESKRRDAFDLGAQEVIVSRNPDEMAAHGGSFGFILNTVAAIHNLDQSPLC